MKPIWNDIITGAVFILLGAAIGAAGEHYRHECPEPERIESKIIRQMDSWDALRLALMERESEFDASAVNGDCWGILQISSQYVSECNRIKGYEYYCHEDAFDVAKSLEMFEVYNERYNPEHDMLRAIKLHNPKAPIWYQNDVLSLYESWAELILIINQL